MITFTLDSSDEIALGRCLGVRDLAYTARIPGGGAASVATLAQAMAVVESGRRRGRAHLAGDERALRLPLRPADRAARRRAGEPRRCRHRFAAVVHAVRRTDAGLLGSAGGPALHGHLRRQEPRPRACLGCAAAPCRDQSGGVVSRPPDHDRRAPAVALDRRAGAAAARLLPGERRRRGPRRHEPRACARPASAPGAHPGRGAVDSRRGRGDLELLPRRSVHDARGAGNRTAHLRALRTHGRRHAGRDALRRLHAAGVEAARGLRLLRPRRGEGLRRATATSSWAGACP